MARIKTEKQYKVVCARIEELLKVVSNDTPTDDKNFLELDLISDLVADYEKEHLYIPHSSGKYQRYTHYFQVVACFFLGSLCHDMHIIM